MNARNHSSGVLLHAEGPEAEIHPPALCVCVCTCTSMHVHTETTPESYGLLLAKQAFYFRMKAPSPSMKHALQQE